MGVARLSVGAGVERRGDGGEAGCCGFWGMCGCGVGVSIVGASTDGERRLNVGVV